MSSSQRARRVRSASTAPQYGTKRHRQFKAIDASATTKKQAPGCGYRGLEADLPDVHIRHAQGVALLTQLPAPLADPAGGLAQFPG